MSIRKVNAYIGSAVVSSSTKSPNTVITGVTCLPATPGVMVALNRLRWGCAARALAGNSSE